MGGTVHNTKSMEASFRRHVQRTVRRRPDALTPMPTPSPKASASRSSFTYVAPGRRNHRRASSHVHDHPSPPRAPDVANISTAIQAAQTILNAASSRMQSMSESCSQAKFHFTQEGRSLARTRSLCRSQRDVGARDVPVILRSPRASDASFGSPDTEAERNPVCARFWTGPLSCRVWLRDLIHDREPRLLRRAPKGWR